MNTSGNVGFVHPGKISIQHYDYPLPEHRIAQFPVEPRDASKLLIYRDGQAGSDIFSNLHAHLPPGALMIFNETRVIHARLLFRKDTGSRIEIFCLEPAGPQADYQLAFQQTGSAEWICLVGNSKRWKGGLLTLAHGDGDGAWTLQAERLQAYPDGTSRVLFRWLPDTMTFAELLERAGKIPLPPYITRQADEHDDLTYQTIYAREDGSVAAPTAGLHFTREVFNNLSEDGTRFLNFTLHVGAGTFRPVASPDLSNHEMHTEPVRYPVEKLRQLRESLDRPIVLVGTTTTRLMESLYWHGVKLIKGLAGGDRVDIRQWDPYDLPDADKISREEALEAVIRHCDRKHISVLEGETRLMIAPGYRFRYPDILITNFHQPKSTLLLLIAAFIGDGWRDAYDYALEHDFRFLSYGDSCLFFKA